MDELFIRFDSVAISSVLFLIFFEWSFFRFLYGGVDVAPATKLQIKNLVFILTIIDFLPHIQLNKKWLLFCATLRQGRQEKEERKKVHQTSLHI